MRAPTSAEQQAALRSIREHAEALKAYEPELVDRLQACLDQHAATLRKAGDGSAEARARRERIVAQCTAVKEAIERARQYPELIMARAVVLDQAGVLARQVRELQAATGG